jgi:hypothetical protein
MSTPTSANAGQVGGGGAPLAEPWPPPREGAPDRTGAPAGSSRRTRSDERQRSVAAGPRDPLAQPPQSDRSAELAERLGGRVTAGGVGPGGQVGGGQLGVTKPDAGLLEQQPAEPCECRALVAVGLLVAQQQTDRKRVVELATAARTAVRLPRSRARRKIGYGEPSDRIELMFA